MQCLSHECHVYWCSVVSESIGSIAIYSMVSPSFFFRILSFSVCSLLAHENANTILLSSAIVCSMGVPYSSTIWYGFQNTSRMVNMAFCISDKAKLMTMQNMIQSTRRCPDIFRTTHNEDMWPNNKNEIKCLEWLAKWIDRLTSVITECIGVSTLH